MNKRLYSYHIIKSLPASPTQSREDTLNYIIIGYSLNTKASNVVT